MNINVSARSLAKAIAQEFQNDFLTVERFAEYHELKLEHAQELLDICRLINMSNHPDA